MANPSVPFCQIDSFPVLRSLVADPKSLCCFATTERSFFRRFHYQLLKFWCAFLVWNPFQHDKSPHLPFSIPYCLTNAVRFILPMPRITRFVPTAPPKGRRPFISAGSGRVISICRYLRILVPRDLPPHRKPDCPTSNR